MAWWWTDGARRSRHPPRTNNRESKVKNGLNALLSMAAVSMAVHGMAWGAVDAKSRQAALAADAKVVAAAAANGKLNSTVPVRAAPVEVVLPPLSAEQIVARNVVARGGLAAWKQVRAMSLQGKLDAGQQRRDGGRIALSRQEGKAFEQQQAALLSRQAEPVAPPVIQLPFKLDLKRPNKMRLEIPFRGETAVQVFDGSKGWKLRPYLGRHEVEPYSADELRIAASEQALDGPLIDHAAKGTRVAVDGGEMVDGRKAYRLKLTLRNGEHRRLWIDAETFLDVKMEGAPRRFDGSMHPVATYFRDFRPVDGVQVARTLETRVEGTRQSERIVIEQVALNPPVDDARFAKPQ
jgi:hypothetical protein